MNFIDFGAFSFLALVPVVILFYLLKLKRKPVIISNTFLWLQAFRDAKADRPFQNLTNNLLLILQILALIFLITVKARPYLKTSFQGGHHTVLIMDNSASMQATDTGKSRLAEAQKASLKIIDQMKSTDEMMIISVGSRPRIEITFTQNKGNLSKTIKSIKPLDSSTSVRDALILAISSLKNYSDGEIFLLSDGNFPDLGDLGPRIPVISFLNFGVNSNNVGITNINLRFSPFSSDFDLLVETENFSQEIKEFSLDIYLDNQLINAHKIRLERGKKKWEIFQNLSAPSGIITARINVKDDLLIDNSAYAVLSLPEPMKILLVSEGNPFLEHLFSITPRVEFSTIKPENYSINKIFDLIIFDGVNLKNIDKGNFIFIGTNVDLKGLRIIGEVKKPVIIAWDKLHPVMRFVELSDVSIAKSFKITPPVNGKILVEAKDTPLMCSIVEENLKGLFICFNLYDSDIILRPAFPILFSNIIEWFNPLSSECFANQIKTGQPIKIRTNSKKIRLTVPDGNEILLEGKKNKETIFSDTFSQGIYTIHDGEEKHYVAVNLADSRESNIKPFKKFSIGNTNFSSSVLDSVVQKEFWKYLALLVLILLTLEWYVFHRKVT